MPLLVVLGDDSEQLVSLLEPGCLPGLQIETAAGSSEAIRRAEILFGPPDQLVDCIDEAANLRWAQSTWAGVAPLVAHARRDYVLTGVKGIFGQSMTEYVLAWLLGIERGVIRRADTSRWDGSLERGIGGRRLGIMGTGSIGRAVARGCEALGLLVSGLNSDGRSVDGFRACFATADRLEFARGLDYLVALLPDTAAARNLVDAELLHCLARGAIFINAGRADTVVDSDLLDALYGGQLRAAVLDVTRVEPLPPGDVFWTTENLYVTSHTAAPSFAEDVVEVFAENYRRYVRGEPLQYRIDFERGY